MSIEGCLSCKSSTEASGSGLPVASLDFWVGETSVHSDEGATWLLQVAS